MLAIQDEVIPLRPQEDSRRLAKKHKREAVAIFGLAVEEEPVRVYAILHRAAYEREHVKNHWWAMWVWEVQLLDHIVHNRDDDNEADG